MRSKIATSNEYKKGPGGEQVREGEELAVEDQQYKAKAGVKSEELNTTEME